MKLHIIISFVYSSFFSRKESFLKKKRIEQA
jgi:hypothetical protein